jgi:hypothetical protein
MDHFQFQQEHSNATGHKSLQSLFDAAATAVSELKAGWDQAALEERATIMKDMNGDVRTGDTTALEVLISGPVDEMRASFAAERTLDKEAAQADGDTDSLTHRSEAAAESDCYTCSLEGRQSCKYPED